MAVDVLIRKKPSHREGSKPGKPAPVPGADVQPGEDGQRTVRPRQLNVGHQMRVFWGHDAIAADPELAAFVVTDDGNQKRDADFLRANSGVRPSQEVAVVGHGFKPIPSDVALGQLPVQLRKESAGLDPIQTKKKRRVAAAASPPVVPIPPFRPVDPACSVKGGPDSADVTSSTEGKYIRYVLPTIDDLESKLEYDADTDDDAIVGELHKGRHRLRRAPHQDPNQLFEYLMSRFERAHQARLMQSRDVWDAFREAQPEARPDPAEICPLDAMKEENPDVMGEVVEEVYAHWLLRRRESVRPLLQSLWCEPPWARLGASGKAPADGADVAEDEPPGVPFIGTDSPARIVTRGRIMSLEEVTERLRDAREELETIRTLLDQMRRKEKFDMIYQREQKAKWENALASPHAAAAAVRDGLLLQPLFQVAESKRMVNIGALGRPLDDRAKVMRGVRTVMDLTTRLSGAKIPLRPRSQGLEEGGGPAPAGPLARRPRDAAPAAAAPAAARRLALLPVGAAAAPRRAGASAPASQGAAEQSSGEREDDSPGAEGERPRSGSTPSCRGPQPKKGDKTRAVLEIYAETGPQLPQLAAAGKKGGPKGRQRGVVNAGVQSGRVEKAARRLKPLPRGSGTRTAGATPVLPRRKPVGVVAPRRPVEKSKEGHQQAKKRRNDDDGTTGQPPSKRASIPGAGPQGPKGPATAAPSRAVKHVRPSDAADVDGGAPMKASTSGDGGDSRPVSPRSKVRQKSSAGPSAEGSGAPKKGVRRVDVIGDGGVRQDAAPSTADPGAPKTMGGRGPGATVTSADPPRKPLNAARIGRPRRTATAGDDKPASGPAGEGRGGGAVSRPSSPPAGACWPPGFSRELRVSQAKPLGWLEFVGNCPLHGRLVGMDRVAKVATVLRAHASCREDWAKLAPQPQETQEQSLKRLKRLFQYTGGRGRKRRGSPPGPDTGGAPPLGKRLRGTSAASDPRAEDDLPISVLSQWGKARARNAAHPPIRKARPVSPKPGPSHKALSTKAGPSQKGTVRVPNGVVRTPNRLHKRPNGLLHGPKGTSKPSPSLPKPAAVAVKVERGATVGRRGGAGDPKFAARGRGAANGLSKDGGAAKSVNHPKAALPGGKKSTASGKAAVASPRNGVVKVEDGAEGGDAGGRGVQRRAGGGDVASTSPGGGGGSSSMSSPRRKPGEAFKWRNPTLPISPRRAAS